MNSGIGLAEIGLVFDLMGGFLLAKSIVFVSNEQIIEESSAKYGYNSDLLLSKFRSRFEGKWGIRYLFLGFVFQSLVLANLNRNVDSVNFLLLTLLFCLTTVFITKKSKLAASLETQQAIKTIKHKNEVRHVVNAGQE